MILKRKIYDKLIEWKNNKTKSALLIEGARRIGKSTIAKKFGEENYKSYIIIDFAKASKNIKDNFNNNLNNLDIFFQNISLEYNTKLYIHESLLIFDEIQKFPKAREAIKYLVEDSRYDFIETGSLISIKENVKDIVIPSEEYKLRMYPLDFEEFLWALNEEILTEYIKKCTCNLTPLDNEYHNKAMRLFHEYMLVGGMPQSVIAYIENNRDFDAADREKRLILSLYKDDISKANKKYQLKVNALFENIPGYLSTHEKEVTLSTIDSSSRISSYTDSFFWLEDSMICNNCYKCNDPHVVFALNKNESKVKCYMGDTGLLVSHAFSESELKTNNLYKDIINGKLSLNKGMLYENVIAQMIVSSGRKLYFYTQYSIQKKRNDIEIDFLISNEVKTHFKVNPIEVKSSKNYTNISYNSFKEKFGKNIDKGYIVHPKQLVVNDNEYRVPPYMFFFMLINKS